MTHPRERLDEVIHQPVRFSIAAALAAADELEFGFVRDLLNVSDSTLSKQATALEEAGYISIRKGYVGKRPRTWFALTQEGRVAFEQHVATLREIAAGAAVPTSRG